MDCLNDMTEKDLRLIEKAEKVYHGDWWMVSGMAKEADTEAAKERLHDIAMRKYHLDEYANDML